MEIMDEFTTVESILRHGKSLARFGDGELKLVDGKHQRNCQMLVPGITYDLRRILNNKIPDLIVGIPRHNACVDPKLHKFWRRQMSRFRRHADLFTTFGSAFVSRGDQAPIMNDAYWELWASVLSGRDVVMLRGSHRNYEKGGFFGSAKSLQIIRGPERDAYSHKERLLKRMMELPKHSLYVLFLGPAATVLAAELCQRGRQALDLGRLVEYYRGYRKEQYETK